MLLQSTSFETEKTASFIWNILSASGSNIYLPPCTTCDPSGYELFTSVQRHPWDSNCQSPSASLPWLMVGVEPLEHWPIHSPFYVASKVNQNYVVLQVGSGGKKVKWIVDDFWYPTCSHFRDGRMAHEVFDNPHVLKLLFFTINCDNKDHTEQCFPKV